MSQFLSAYDLARPLQQERQELKRLLLKVNWSATLPELPGGEIGLEYAEPHLAPVVGSRHVSLGPAPTLRSFRMRS